MFITSDVEIDVGIAGSTASKEPNGVNLLQKEKRIMKPNLQEELPTKFPELLVPIDFEHGAHCNICRTSLGTQNTRSRQSKLSVLVLEDDEGNFWYSKDMKRSGDSFHLLGQEC